MDDARKQEIMARANAVLERLDDEAMAASWADIAKRERIERVQKCLDYTPEQPHDDGGLPPDEQDAVKQWVWKQSGQATPAPPIGPALSVCEMVPFVVVMWQSAQVLPKCTDSGGTVRLSSEPVWWHRVHRSMTPVTFLYA